MTDEELEELMKAAGPSYRAGSPPPVERMWAEIQARAFADRATVVAPIRAGGNRSRFLALAATLVLGVGLGWGGASLRQGGPPAVVDRPVAPVEVISAAVTSDPSPFVGVARDYFQQTTGLVVALASDIRTGKVLGSTITRAREVLSTTRMLMDGELGDPAIRELLQDLELVLAQVVRLPQARQPNADAQLIADAMDQREVLSRLTLIISDAQTAP